MRREGLRQLIIDATIITQRQETPLAGLETWIQVNLVQTFVITMSYLRL